ncbi:DUF3846 domain-containing protein [Deinococcus pimensis]|uniref:DUF3846 domain-containing protein n=1 Tax=Deinococcus pimensis TaxID=309888 RepID=UPI000485AD59|nr:hypothetical protein [Deinococcus pimensis]
MRSFVILHPNGSIESKQLPVETNARLRALQLAVGGPIEYLSPAFHRLDRHDVVIGEDGLHRLPDNVIGSRIIGMNLTRYRPLCGPIVLVPRNEAEHGRIEDERKCALAFLERLETNPDELLIVDFRE